MPTARRGHCRSLSAPSESTPTVTPWDISPGAFQLLKENWQGWKWKMTTRSNGEKRKRSFYDRRIALEEDVAQLQTQLKTERALRQGLETALRRSDFNELPFVPYAGNISAFDFSPKAKELITEITNLETEVANLEHHVLSLYRKVLDQQMCTSPTLSSVSSVHNVPNLSGLSTPSDCNAQAHQGQFPKISLKRKGGALVSSHRRNVSSSTTPPNIETHQDTTFGLQSKSRHVSLLGGAFNCIDGSSAQERSHQLPTESALTAVMQDAVVSPDSFGQTSETSTLIECGRSEAQFLTTRRDLHTKKAHLPSLQPTLTLLTSAPTSESGFGNYSDSARVFHGTPSRLSEELVRCMAAIYCKLADPPLPAVSGPISPSSSSSSSRSCMSMSSTQGFSLDSWGSPGWRGGDTHPEVAPLVDPFQLKHRKGDEVGTYRSAVEVPWICVDKDRLNYAARALRNFRSLVEQLERVDPALMRHEEKVAFWINVYNALMMHAYLAYGIPRGHLKKISLVQKASYKVGRHSVNAHMIEHCILGCRARKPTQWLQSLFSAATKFKPGDERKFYALERTEPLVCFALCSGGRSDPAVRVYTAKNVRRELEFARKDYIEASTGVRGSKVLLPRILEWYAKETSVPLGILIEWVSQFVNEKQQKVIKSLLTSKTLKSAANAIEWIPYNSSFRYIFSRDLAKAVPQTAR